MIDILWSKFEVIHYSRAPRTHDVCHRPSSLAAHGTIHCFKMESSARGRSATADEMHASGLFTTQAYESCLAVLNTMAGEVDGAYKQPQFKALRKALVPFVQEMVSQFPTDPRRSRVNRKDELKRARQSRKQADEAADRKLLDSRKLRADRIKRLKGKVSESNLFPMSLVNRLYLAFLYHYVFFN